MARPPASPLLSASPRASSAQRASWNARRSSPAGHHPARAGREVGADLLGGARAQALGEREQLLVVARRACGASSTHEKRAGAGGQAGGRLVAQRARQRVLGRRLERARRREHEHGGAVAQAERLQAARQLGAVELARRPSR